MPSTPRQLRLNSFLDEPNLRQAVKIAAAKEGVTVSTYCVRAVRRQLGEEGFLPGSEERRAEAARAMDHLRRQIGPIGVSVRELIDAGRRR